MKKSILTLTLTIITQAAFANSFDTANGDVNVSTGGIVSVHLQNASHYSNGTYRKDNTIFLQVSSDGQITGKVGIWLDYRKGSTLENGQKAKNKKAVLIVANTKAMTMCLELGGNVLALGQQVAESNLMVPAGEFYRLYTAYSEVTCDLTNKSPEVVTAIDEALRVATPGQQVKLLEIRSNLLNQ